MKQTILVIEDEEAIRDLIKLSLELANYEVLIAEHTKQAQKIIADKIPLLIILDWMLPGTSGIDFISILKNDAMTKQIPIILLTAKATEESKIHGLESGADDYITKPFSPKELVARIKTVLRRGILTTPESIVIIGPLRIDYEKHQTYINGKLLELSPLEYRLLAFFVRHQEKTYQREQLIMQVWGGASDITDRTVDVTIRRLRINLANQGLHDCIQTIRGVGYQFTMNNYKG